MTSTSAAPSRPAEPMREPDFVMAKVARWVEHPGADSELTLADGSHWRFDARRPDHAAFAAFVEGALKHDEPLLVSGDRADGIVGGFGFAWPLAVWRVGDEDANGVVTVSFRVTAPVYHVRLSRPGAAADLVLLRRSAARGAGVLTPDLLVGIDTRTSEVLAVRPWT